MRPPNFVGNPRRPIVQMVVRWKYTTKLFEELYEIKGNHQPSGGEQR